MPAALKSTAIEVTALVDGDLERAELLARMYDCRCELSATLNPVLGKVDGVLIATPNHTHVPLAQAALEHGLPVLIEKPLATSYADAARLCELARTKNTFISVGFMTRHYPVVRLVRRLLDENFFGRLISFHFEYGTRGGWAPHSGYNLSRDQSGGGVLVVSGTHFLDRMLFWFGAPENFRYADDSLGGVEANSKAWLDFGDGFTGTLFFSKTINLANRFVMETDHYQIEIPWAKQTEIKLHARKWPGIEMTITESAPVECNDYFQLQLEEFARVIHEGGSPTVDGEAGARSVKLCEDFYTHSTQLEEPWIWYRNLPVDL